MKRLFRSSNACILGAATLVCAVSWSALLHAHDALNKEIIRLDRHLNQSSAIDNEQLHLLLRRADLHRRQKNWQAALIDLENAEAIQPKNHRMLLGRAELYLDQNNYSAASIWSARLLELRSDHVQGLMIQARAHTGLGNTDKAAGFYDRAISLMKNPTPEHFLEFAQAKLRSGKDNASEDAISIADTGARRLGHPISLHSFALEQELLSAQPDAALKRINQVVELYPRLLPWRLKKVELLVSLDRNSEACPALKSLDSDFRQLPPRRSSTRAMQSLQASLANLQLVCAGG